MSVYDTECTLLYDTERVTWKKLGLHKNLLTIGDMRNEVARCLESSWWAKHFPEWWVSFAPEATEPPRVTVSTLHGLEESAEYLWQEGKLRFGVRCMHRGIIAHELAHVAATVDETDHGAAFRRRYLKIFRWLLGDRAGQELAADFAWNNVGAGS